MQITEKQFLEICPRRGPAWEVYKQCRDEGEKVLLSGDSQTVIAIRSDFGIIPQGRKALDS